MKKERDQSIITQKNIVFLVSSEMLICGKHTQAHGQDMVSL